MAWRRTLALAVGLLLAGGPAPPLAGQATAAADAPGEVRTGRYESEHGARDYRLYIPEGGVASSRPLVVMLHGCTQTVEDFATGTRADAYGQATGAAVLYPEQAPEAHPQRCWNWYAPAHQARGSGEPEILAGMIRQVIAAMGEETRGEPGAVYVAGLSAGGAMAQTLAAAYPELVSALAVHSAPAYRSAGDLPTALAVLQHGATDPAALSALVLDAMGARARPVPTLVIQGAADAVVRPVNGTQVLRQWLGVAETTAGAVRLEHWRVEGLGHAWSGGAPDGSYTDPSTPDATARVFEFFLGGGGSS